MAGTRAVVVRATDERTPLRKRSGTPGDGDRARRVPRPLWHRLKGGTIYSDIHSVSGTPDKGKCAMICVMSTSFLLLVLLWGYFCYILWARAIAMYSTEWAEGQCTVLAVEDYAHSDCYGYKDGKVPSGDEAAGKSLGRRALLAGAQNRLLMTSGQSAAENRGVEVMGLTTSPSAADDRVSLQDRKDFGSHLDRPAQQVVGHVSQTLALVQHRRPGAARHGMVLEATGLDVAEYGSASREPGGAAVYAAPEGRPRGASSSSCSDGVMNGNETGVDCASSEGGSVRFGVHSRSAGRGAS
jgi:hypothetical protein